MSKTKLIEKPVKKTRSVKKSQSSSKTNLVGLFPMLQMMKKGKRPLKYKQKTQQALKSSGSSEQDQNIIINLNLGQYGFDTIIKQESINKIIETVRRVQIFAEKPTEIIEEWNFIYDQIENKLQNNIVMISKKDDCLLFTSSKMIEINQYEYSVWLIMYQIVKKIISNSSIYSSMHDVVKQDAQNVINKMLQCQVFRQKCIENQQNQQIYHIFQKLLKKIMYKTFLNGLKVFTIDQLNYFLFKQFQENSRMQKRRYKIENWLQWANFIQKKRVRLRKANKFILHTSCQLCLSSYFQQLNPIVNCQQCHARAHKLCLGMDRMSRCGRCLYLRLPNQSKQQISECCLCPVKNLVPIRISPNKFAHGFCLFANRVWDIENSSLVYRLNSSNNTQKQVQICTICKIESPNTSKCIKCQKSYHYLCAYMNGIQLQNNDKNNIQLICCRNTQQQSQKLAYCRKYILNYNGLVFKKLAQIQQSNKKKNKKRALKLNLRQISQGSSQNQQQQQQSSLKAQMHKQQQLQQREREG